MMVFAAVVLFVAAAFNLVTWPIFFRRVVRDPRARNEQGRRTAFYVVHLVLLVIALTIAVVAATLGGLLLLV